MMHFLNFGLASESDFWHPKCTQNEPLNYVHIGNKVSHLSVAGAGVTGSEDISSLHSKVISASKAAREHYSYSKFLAPIIGAVIAGFDIAQETARVARCIPCSEA